MMPNLYKITDIKIPKNGIDNAHAISFDSILTDFQRFAYTIQLAEQIFMQRGLDESNIPMPIWVKEPERFIPQQERLEDFFTSFFGYPVKLNIIKNDSSQPDTQTSLFKPDFNFDSACLFSGGLDSGTYAMECKKNNLSIILHHTITHNIPFGKSKELFAKHLRNSKLKFTHTRGNNKVSQPMYLKTRGLIFLTNLLCIASQFKIKIIVIPENGPFMINIPISPSAEPTRTTDPNMLNEWTSIFNYITNSKIKISTPYYNLTKSEVIIRGNRDIIQDTWSCSYFQGLSKMCGMCNSCLVRILSCYAINEGEDLAYCYTENPFLVKEAKLKSANRNSYRVSIDAIDFWKCIIDPALAKNKIEKIRFEDIQDNHKVMINHSLDMFLGFQNLKKIYPSTEPLYMNFDNALNEIDKDKLKSRSFSLQEKMKQFGWN